MCKVNLNGELIVECAVIKRAEALGLLLLSIAMTNLVIVAVQHDSGTHALCSGSLEQANDVYETLRVSGKPIELVTT